MTQYASTTDLHAVARLLREADGPIVVLTHGKPDGDAFGSVIALKAGLRGLGKEDVHAYFVPPVPANLLRLPGAELATVFDEKTTQLPEPALVVVLDTGAYVQVGPMRPFIEKHLDRTLMIDHHLSGDIPAKHRVIDGGAAACVELIAELLDVLGVWAMFPHPDYGDGEGPGLLRIVADALFTGLASDTGWFRFSNTTARTHRLAARLRDAGVDHAELYHLLEQNERPQKLLLLRRALDSLELLADDRVAVMVLRQRDFAETGAVEAETERLIDVPQQVGSIQVVALVTQRQGKDGKSTTAVSFRSKPGQDAVDVAALAGQFGGGGHARAAGAKIDAPLDDALPRIRAALTDAV